MKVKCINSDNRYHITVGKTYEVIGKVNYSYEIINDKGYRIIDDNGHDWWYQKQYFKTLSEIRNEKIDKLLEDEN